MRIFFAFLFMLLAAPILITQAFAAPIIGQPAPDFTGTDTTGNERSLSTFLGKTVVLEWTNHDCPYVKKHYESGNMQATQQYAADQGAVWLRIISSAPGKQGHLSAVQANEIVEDMNVISEATILDESGEIGQLYGAKTTPHMFVIDPDGLLVYAGAIDDKPTTNPDDIAGATNYVKAALEDLREGDFVSVTSTQPYGCGIKYAE